MLLLVLQDFSCWLRCSSSAFDLVSPPSDARFPSPFPHLESLDPSSSFPTFSCFRSSLPSLFPYSYGSDARHVSIRQTSYRSTFTCDIMPGIAEDPPAVLHQPGDLNVRPKGIVMLPSASTVPVGRSENGRLIVFQESSRILHSPAPVKVIVPQPMRPQSSRPRPPASRCPNPPTRKSLLYKIPSKMPAIDGPVQQVAVRLVADDFRSLEISPERMRKART